MSLPDCVVGDPYSGLLAAYWDEKVRVVDLETRTSVFAMQTDAMVRGASVSSQLGLLFVSFRGGGVASYSMSNSSRLWSNEDVTGINELVICGDQVAAVASDTVTWLDSRDGRTIGEKRGVNAYFVDSAQSQFVSVRRGSAERGVLASGESQPLEWPSFSALHCSFQGERVAISAPDGLLAVYARESSQPVATWLDTSKVFNFPWIAFQEDGSLLAVATGFMGKPEMCVVELDRDLKEIQLVQKLSPCAHVTSLDHSKYMVTLAGEIFHAEERGIVGKLDWTDYFS